MTSLFDSLLAFIPNISREVKLYVPLYAFVAKLNVYWYYIRMYIDADL